MSVLEEGCPQPLTRRHVSLLMPDNDLPCRSRGLPGDAGFSVAVVEASRENLQRCDCSRYRGKTTATLPPPTPPSLYVYANRSANSHLQTTVHATLSAPSPPLSLPGNCPIFQPAPVELVGSVGSPGHGHSSVWRALPTSPPGLPQCSAFQLRSRQG